MIRRLYPHDWGSGLLAVTMGARNSLDLSGESRAMEDSRMAEGILPVPPLGVLLGSILVRYLPAGRHRAMNLLGRRFNKPFLMTMPPDLGGYTFECDLRDYLSREVCFTGRYEPQETVLVQRILSPGMTFVDVGANWGYFTLLGVHLVGRSGRVISLEPHPVLFEVLQKNIKRNGLGRVTALQLAASSEFGSCELLGYDIGNYGTSQIVTNPQCPGRLRKVPMAPMDGVFHELDLKSVDLLKMDIEGAEGFALRGLVKSLANFRINRLILELHPELLVHHGQSAQIVIRQLSNLGYRAWAIDHSRRGTRRAVYGKRLDAKTFLRPFLPTEVLDGWPHLLFVKPAMEPLP
jgi:FkbM family methyltransferase